MYENLPAFEQLSFATLLVAISLLAMVLLLGGILAWQKYKRSSRVVERGSGRGDDVEKEAEEERYRDGGVLGRDGGGVVVVVGDRKER